VIPLQFGSDGALAVVAPAHTAATTEIRMTRVARLRFHSNRAVDRRDLPAVCRTT
jgi:hypothetical protein